VISLELRRDFLAPENLSPWAIVWRCLCNPRFSHLCRTLDLWQTDRQTHDDSIYCASISSCGKNVTLDKQYCTVLIYTARPLYCLLTDLNHDKTRLKLTTSYSRYARWNYSSKLLQQIDVYFDDTWTKFVDTSLFKKRNIGADWSTRWPRKRERSVLFVINHVISLISASKCPRRFEKRFSVSAIIYCHPRRHWSSMT